MIKLEDLLAVAKNNIAIMNGSFQSIVVANKTCLFMEVIFMNKDLIYDTLDCMRGIKKKYPWIPKFIIRRVLFAEECYMHKIGIIDWKPDLKSWYFKK